MSETIEQTEPAAAAAAAEAPAPAERVHVTRSRAKPGGTAADADGTVPFSAPASRRG